MIFKVKILFFFCFILFSSPLCAQDQAPTGSGGVPVGMENIQVTPGFQMLVPQGAKIRRVGAQIIVEDDKEYFSRRLYESSQDIEDLKDQCKQLQDRVNQLEEKAKSDAPSNPQ
ncbi:MAG: hypothetical protein WCX16_00595 [Candidatus Omnitrophota bacterium]